MVALAVQAVPLVLPVVLLGTAEAEAVTRLQMRLPVLVGPVRPLAALAAVEVVEETVKMAVPVVLALAPKSRSGCMADACLSSNS